MGREGQRPGRLVDGQALSPSYQPAVEVAFLFSVYDRMADATRWDVPPLSCGYCQMAARLLLKHGYL